MRPWRKRRSPGPARPLSGEVTRAVHLWFWRSFAAGLGKLLVFVGGRLDYKIVEGNACCTEEKNDRDAEQQNPAISAELGSGRGKDAGSRRRDALSGPASCAGTGIVVLVSGARRANDRPVTAKSGSSDCAVPGRVGGPDSQRGHVS